MKRVIPNQTFMRLLFTGRSGSTKTRTAYSAVLDERTFPVLGLDVMGQPRSIADYRPQPDIIAIESLSDLSQVYNWLAAGQPAGDKLVRDLDLKPPYRTVIPDGFSEIQRLVVAAITGATNKNLSDRPSPVQIQDYGTILAQTLAIAEKFYKLPMHVIGTVLEQERGGEGQPISFRHQLVGQARDQLSSYPEVVARLTHIERVSATVKQSLKDAITEDTVSIAIFKPGVRHEAKDQTGKLGDVMVDPTITKILDALGL